MPESDQPHSSRPARETPPPEGKPGPEGRKQETPAPRTTLEKAKENQDPAQSIIVPDQQDG